MSKPVADLSYRHEGLFTTFYPNNVAGEAAWRVIAEQNDGVAKVLAHQTKSTIQQLRKAGYSVAVCRKVSQGNDDSLLDELFK